jgi:hypothetical protein
MSNKTRKRLVPELQRALALENIAANYVSSGNQKDMVEELSKLTSATITTGDLPLSSKKAKKQSSNQVYNSADSAMIDSNVTTYRSTKQQ